MGGSDSNIMMLSMWIVVWRVMASSGRVSSMCNSRFELGDGGGEGGVRGVGGG